MKRIATLFAFLVTSASVLFAQNLSVKGLVYDYDSAEPLFPANVQIYQISGSDSTFIGGASTEDDGSFVVNNLKAGNYRARVTYVGYDDAVKNFTLRSGTAMTDLGKITLRGGQMLEEVAISAVVQKVQLINDTVMFNSAAFKLPEGSSVEDLIRKLPGVQIGSDGDITVNGKSVSRILVNGKEFFDNDKTVALTQLTADMIERVKSYEKQRDRAGPRLCSSYTGNRTAGERCRTNAWRYDQEVQPSPLLTLTLTFTLTLKSREEGVAVRCGLCYNARII